MLTPSRKEQIVELCRELVRIRSYSGEEDQVIEKVKGVMQEFGFDEVVIDGYGSIVGHLKGRRSGKIILFDGHLDTVPVSDPGQWNHDPFGAEIQNGRIYGRGTSDMKGAVSAMLCAAAYFAEDFQKDFFGDLYVAGVVQEECFEGVASKKVSEMVKPDYVVIGEASHCNLKRGQKGRAEIIVETFGKTAHSANPQQGINAVYKAVKLIDRIKRIEVAHHEILGEGILELTDVKSSPYPGESVLPDRCSITFDRRLLVGETRKSVLRPLWEIIKELEKEDPEFKAEVYYARGEDICYTGEKIRSERFFPGWLFDETDDYVQEVYQALKDVGLDPEISTYRFCTNGSHYAGEAGIKTVGFGPSLETLAHTVDEYIEIEQLLLAAEGYYGIMKKILI